MRVKSAFRIWLFTSNHVSLWDLLGSTRLSIPVITMKRMAPETPTPRIQTDRAMFMGFRIHSLNLSHRELQSIFFTKGTVKRLDVEGDGL
jgi:hypothetical protein